jgi:hypothetical protein
LTLRARSLADTASVEDWQNPCRGTCLGLCAKS